MPRSIVVPLCALVFAGCVAGCRSESRPADDPVDSTRPAKVDGVTTVTPADSGCAPAPLADSAAGPVRLGMTVEQLRTRCPGARDSTGLADEGMPARSLVVPVGTDTVEASIVDGRAWRLAVTTRGIRTADSLGVGTPLSRLLALPGARGIAGEGRAFIVADRPCGLSFELDARGAPASDEGIRGMEGGTRVRRVLVTGCGGT